MPGKQWIFTPHDRPTIEQFAEACCVPPLVAQLLLKRGIASREDARRFLDAKLVDLHSPEMLPGLSKAVDCIVAAIKTGDPLAVYGDYDADGMTATAILFRCLKLIGANVSYHLPNRMEEGYGLHVETIEKLAEHGKRLVITVDCGIASIEAAERARQLGLSLIITDHHRPGSVLPVATAIVHPDLPGTDYPFAGLCGAGVAFKLAWALCQNYSGSVRVTDHLRNFLIQAVGLAAIGTVADVVPLLDENRIIVRNGLKAIQTNAPLGLQKLMALNQLDKKSTLASDDIAFTIAPRLNAAGRLGQAQLGVELLTTEDDARADALVSYIQELNESRNKLERSINLAASKQLKEEHSIEDDPAFVLASPNWHPGVIGIVAGRLAEKYHRPVVMIAFDKLGSKPGIGSCRSPNGVNLHLALQQCQDLLVSGGGHAAAAGLKIDECNLNAFRSAFMEAVAEQSSSGAAQPEVCFDAEATLHEIDLGTLTQIEQLAPFGMGNPRPTFCAMKVSLPEPAKLLGTSGKHIAMTIHQGKASMRAVSFGTAEDWLPHLETPNQTLDIAFRPTVNEFRGFRKVEMHLVDWRRHDSSSQKSTKPHPLVTEARNP